MDMLDLSRREFIALATAATLALPACATRMGKSAGCERFKFDISLAAWSLHRTIGKNPGQVPMLDMPKLAREQWDIGAIELVNNMLASSEKAYVDELLKNAATHNVKILLIMVDGQGAVGDVSEEERNRAVVNHSRWIDIAADMGCHSIRMNWAGAPHDLMDWDNAEGKPVRDEEVLRIFIDNSIAPLQQLCDYGDKKNINVIIENHGGPSSHAPAMVRLAEKVDHPRFGTLPDFGNFAPSTDVYKSIDALMYYAKAVSAKCHDFDDVTGDETRLDYARLLKNVVDKHNYHGYIGIEYEGSRLSEFDGITAAKKLLERYRVQS